VNLKRSTCDALAGSDGWLDRISCFKYELQLNLIALSCKFHAVRLVGFPCFLLTLWGAKPHFLAPSTHLQRPIKVTVCTEAERGVRHGARAQPDVKAKRIGWEFRRTNGAPQQFQDLCFALARQVTGLDLYARRFREERLEFGGREGFFRWVCGELCIIRALASLGREEQKFEMFREGCKIASILFAFLHQAKNSTVAAQCVVKLVHKTQLHDGCQVPQCIAPSLLLKQTRLKMHRGFKSTDS
jgi:hypothetical protein